MRNNCLEIVFIVFLLLVVMSTFPAIAARAGAVHTVYTAVHKGNSSEGVIVAAGEGNVSVCKIVTLGATQDTGTGETTPADTILGVYVFGAERTKKYIILKKFGLQPGIPFSEREVEEGLRSIEELSGVEKASFRLLRNDEEEGVRLIIVITEQNTRTITPLARRTFANKIALGLAFDEANFLGKDEKLHASALFRGATILEGSWLKPYFLQSPLLSIGARARYKFYRYPYPDFEDLLIDDEISRLEAAASLHVHPTEFLTVSLSPGVDWIEVADSMLVGQGEASIPPAPSGTFPTFETKLTIDMLDREFYPRNGFRITAARKDWGIFQSEAAMKNFLYRFRGIFFIKLRRMLLSLDSRGTFVHGRTPITLVQHLGGEETIRGYDFGVLSGDNRILGRTEVRIPLNFEDIDDLGNPIILVDFNIFLDTGACWNSSESLDTDRFHSGFGCGLNFIPIENRLIRIGYAWQRETTGMFYFDIGTMF
jgi:outer membrane protein assembly factor BamA